MLSSRLFFSSVVRVLYSETYSNSEMTLTVIVGGEKRRSPIKNGDLVPLQYIHDEVSPEVCSLKPPNTRRLAGSAQVQKESIQTGCEASCIC